VRGPAVYYLDHACRHHPDRQYPNCALILVTLAAFELGLVLPSAQRWPGALAGADFAREEAGLSPKWRSFAKPRLSRELADRMRRERDFAI
jgi:hypothetical protein